MPVNSAINLGIPETPDVENPRDYAQHLLIYNALRALQGAVDGISTLPPSASSVHDRAYTFFISGTR